MKHPTTIIKNPSNQLIKCKVCNEEKILGNERIVLTRICYTCTLRLIPYYIPEEQHYNYIRLKGLLHYESNES